MGSNDADKQRAFQLVYADDAHGLAQELDRHKPEAWSAWRNFADRTLYQVSFRHDVRVPKPEVKFVDRHEVRPREVTVQNVTEYPVIVEQIEVERKSVTLTDTEITHNIRYVPQLPMQTEWVRQGSQAGTAQFVGPIAGTRGHYAVRELGGNTTNTSPGGDDLWCELNLLRSRNSHLARMSARLKGNLDRCGARARQLGDQLARERQLRQDKERQALELERGVATVTHLTKLPVRILGSAEVDCFQSPHRSNRSTTFTSSILQESAISRRSPFVTPERPGRIDPTFSS